MDNNLKICHIISSDFSHWVFEEFNDVSSILSPHIFFLQGFFFEVLKLLIDLKTRCDQGGVKKQSIASGDEPIGLE